LSSHKGCKGFVEQPDMLAVRFSENPVGEALERGEVDLHDYLSCLITGGTNLIDFLNFGKRPMSVLYIDLTSISFA